VPEAVHASECSIVWGEEVSTVCEYLEEEAIGNAIATERSDAGPWGGEALDEGEDCLGQGESVPVLVDCVKGGGEPVSQPCDHLGGSEMVAFQFYWGTQGGRPLAWGPPVAEFGVGD